MPNRPLTWTFFGSNRTSRLSQIAAIARAEPLGSSGYLIHVTLLCFASFCGVLLFSMWFLGVIVAAYLAVLTFEKWLSARAVAASKALYYWPILGVLFLRGLIYNTIVVYVWAIDGDVFQFAAAALLVAATINIFVFHATHFEIIVAVITPLWLCYLAITALAFAQYGVGVQSLSFLLILICVIPYFLMALKFTLDRWTENDLIRQSLSHNQKLDALGSLVAGVAHDFNNILTVTRGNAELMKGAVSPQTEEMVDEIIRASERGSALSAQLLAFGRRSVLTPERVDVDEFMFASETLLRRVLPENINLTVHSSLGVPAIFVDRNQLETAIVNLTINARDAVDDGGSITIEADRMVLRGQGVGQLGTPLTPGEYVMISVSDDGQGIPDDLVDHIFDPFFTTKEVGKGSGLGLSMVIGFAEQSAGGVKLDSKVGLGTRVSLFLPAYNPEVVSDT